MIREIATYVAAAGDSCDVGGGSFLGFPHWYEYLPGLEGANGVCSPGLQSLSDVWLILAAVIEILLRVGALAAIGFVLYGGVQYITSQAEPDKTSKAKQTVINALVGLGITIVATAAITFVAGRFN